MIENFLVSSQSITFAMAEDGAPFPEIKQKFPLLVLNFASNILEEIGKKIIAPFATESDALIAVETSNHPAIVFYLIVDCAQPVEINGCGDLKIFTPNPESRTVLCEQKTEETIKRLVSGCKLPLDKKAIGLFKEYLENSACLVGVGSQTKSGSAIFPEWHTVKSNILGTSIEQVEFQAQARCGAMDNFINV